MLRNVVIGIACCLAMTEAVVAEDVTLIVRNNLQFGNGGKHAAVWVKSLQSLTPQNPWRRLDIPAGRTAKLPLASPDKFVIRAEAGGVTYETEPIPLKEWLSQNPKFELNLDIVAAAPAGQMQRMPKADFGMRLEAPPTGDETVGEWKMLEYKEVRGTNRRGSRRGR
jgi:hypothetical protein